MSSHIPSLFTTLAASAMLIGYLLYGTIKVPSGIEQGDQLVWFFAKMKYTRLMSELGEYFGFGHQVNITRAIRELSASTTEKDYIELQVSNHTFDGVPVRVYEPEGRQGVVPGIIYIHGGAWAFGSVDSSESYPISMARRLGVVVVSIEYRLAPEHPYPAAFEDCLKATTHFLKNAAKYGTDSGRIALVGGSAGANLAAAVSLKLAASDDTTPRPELQVLMVPCLQPLDFNTPSYQQNEHSAFLPKHFMVAAWLWYALGSDGHRLMDAVGRNDHTSAEAKRVTVAKYVDHMMLGQQNIGDSYVPNDRNFGNETLWEELKPIFTDPYFAPLAAPDLHGVPETYIATAQYDVLRDDGILFAKRLLAVGVEVKHVHYDKGYHGSVILMGHMKTSVKMIDDLVEYLAVKL